MSAINLTSTHVYSTALQQKSRGIQDIFSALDAGDLKSAQTAYAASGLPAMIAKNSSPLGRLFNALRNEDLKNAQQASLDMQGSKGK